MMFGREVLLPIDLSLGPVEEDTEYTALPTVSYVEELGEMMKIVNGIARTKMVSVSDRQKQGYDHTANFKSHEREILYFLSIRFGKGEYLLNSSHSGVAHSW